MGLDSGTRWQASELPLAPGLPSPATNLVGALLRDSVRLRSAIV